MPTCIFLCIIYLLPVATTWFELNQWIDMLLEVVISILGLSLNQVGATGS